MLVTLSLLLACSSTKVDSGIDGLSIDLATDGTLPVADLSWTLDTSVTDATVSAATALVDTADGESWQVDASAGSAVLWGLPPDTDVDVQVVFVIDDAEQESDVATIHTPVADADLPALSVEGDSARAFDGQLALTANVTSPGAAVMIDGQGRYRWWASVSDSDQVGRARLSRDGTQILAQPVNVHGDDTTGLLRFDRHGDVVDTVQIDGQHHDFLELSDGTLVFLVQSLGTASGRTMIGDKLVEVAPDRTQTTIWDIWDAIPYNEDDRWMPDDQWSHANTLSFDEATQTYTVSFFGLRALARIDRATGELLWLMGTSDSDFVGADGDTTVLHGSHGFQFLDGSLLAFENGDSSDADSRAVELSFDEDEPVMTELWSFAPSPSLYSFSLGDVQRLDSGDTLADFSANGTMIQVDAAGTEQWKLTAGVGGAFGYVQVLGEAGSF